MQPAQAAQFLDAAKRAVEIAIKDSEAAALAWLAHAEISLRRRVNDFDPVGSCIPSAPRISLTYS